MSKAMIDKKSDGSAASRWQAPPESAPSAMRAKGVAVFRILGWFSVGLFLFGLCSVVINLQVGPRFIGMGLGSLFAVLGASGMLLHAASEPELQIRRAYMAFAYLLLICGAVFSLVPYHGPVGTQFLPWGFILFGFGLLMLMAFLRNETDEQVRGVALRVLGSAGAIISLTGFLVSNINDNFLLPQGLMLILLGLAFLWAYAALKNTLDGQGYRVGLGIGLVGLIVLVIALGRSLLPPLFARWGWTQPSPNSYFLPSGLLLSICGLLYVSLSAGLCSDRRLIVMTRRELAAFFLSPLFYIILLGFAVVAWGLFVYFVLQNIGISMPNPVPEPMLARYILGWFTVICSIFVVPVLTMRLLSEERRTGTLEMLLTAPLGETPVVVSKFLAAFFVYLMIWVPWGLFLLALRVEGGQPFDYRPLISFFMALAFSGAGFIAMGVFFSSLTRNQVAAAIMTFVGMLALTLTFFLKMLDIVPWLGEGKAAHTILTHISYIDLWINSLEGKLAARDLVFHLSAAVFWLFLTVKALESRKWR